MPTVSFASDIRPLFRPEDLETMKPHGLDLSSYQGVRQNAEAILSRLEAGGMPCDGSWADDWIEKFRRWMDAGMPA
ncbi:MAG: hypothetical protein ABSG73_07325 [Candidatus Aminicenantales bacterium]|jgi:hypothetical protein